MQQLFTKWQYSDDDTLTWNDLSDGGTYSGVNTNTLSLTAVTEEIDGYYYRLKITTPALGCADPVFTNAAMLTAKDDSDDDGIPNSNDDDSDNDGILDLYEGGNNTKIMTETNSLIILILILMEMDVMMLLRDIVILTETLFLELVLPEVFPVFGLVVGVNYNKTPNFDSDENGVFDFQEFRGPITISHPVNVVSSQGKKEVFEASATATSPIAFQWQP